MQPLLLLGAAAALFALLSAAAPAAETVDPAQDEKTAAELRLQADKGNGDAALRLGNLLARNRISRTRYGNAVDWYKKGCALNNLSACHNAGVSHEFGRNGAKPNYTEAANYYLKSAERAFLPSLLNLAILHADGRVTSLDNRDGLKWMLIAQKAAAQCPQTAICRLALEDPKGYRARLEAALSVDERREARQLAERWQPVP
jgi:TPR repeat protein